MKLVSIVIPTYGGGDYLIRAVDSVLNQDYENIEVVVVDDNGQCTDNQIKTQNYMQIFKENNRVKYIKHTENFNGAVARNSGVKHSKGEYIGFLDDDDTYLKNNITKQTEVLERLDHSWGMSYCSHKVFLNGKHIETVRKKKSGSLLYDILLHKVTIGSSSLLIRREAYERVNGFDESFKRHQDWEFTARVASEYKIHVVENIGFIRNLMFRNSPENLQRAKDYRNHYLIKMKPLITKYSPKKQREIVITNKLQLIFKYLRKGQLKTFIEEYRNANAGVFGIWILVKSTFSYIFSKFKNKLIIN
ncbi:glycosyltransferase family 2 protein [Salinicoccus siamensis]|uniref:Putative glycosyltransferase TagX n=1 Tax=Salinicoccus siamensis TaxID=381830 RepID=A0ABV5Z4I3_9STAP